MGYRTLPSDAWPRVRESQLTDIYQAVRYLADRTDVDGKNIAVLGDEQACTLDSEIRMCVAGVLAEQANGFAAERETEVPELDQETDSRDAGDAEARDNGFGKDIPELPRYATARGSRGGVEVAGGPLCLLVFGAAGEHGYKERRTLRHGSVIPLSFLRYLWQTRSYRSSR